MPRPGARAAALLLTLHALALPAHAQLVRGRVIRAGTETPLADVSVQLRAADGRILASSASNAAGEFRLHSSRLGAVTVVAERIGLQTVTSEELLLSVSEIVEIEIAMAETAVPLDPLTVRAREYADIGPLAGYFHRMERNRKMGFGHVLSRDEIQERSAVDVADMMREIPRLSVVEQRGRGFHVVFRGAQGTCTPKVFLNGVLANRGGLAFLDELVRPHELEGIEIYRGIAEMPGEFYDETHCGVIIMWTRRDAEGGRPFAWKRVLLTLGGIAAFSLFLFH